MFRTCRLGKSLDEHIILAGYASSLVPGFNQHARNLLMSDTAGESPFHLSA